jgi:glycosyltransferase involved in cell wall biosynthesis
VPQETRQNRASLAVRLTNDPWAAEAEDPELDVARAADLPRLLFRPPPGCERLIVVGSPPDQEVGFGFIPLVALRARPKVVELVDIESGRRDRSSLRRFLATASVPALAQITTSGAGIALQTAAALMFRAKGVSKRGANSTGDLRRVLYVRAGFGVSTAVGGSATHTHEVIRALRQIGISVDAVTNDERIAESAAQDPDPPCVWRVVRSSRLLLAAPPSASLAGDLAVVRAALPAARAADVIYQRHGRFSLVGAILATLTGKPLFLEYNGSELYFQEHWQPGPFGRQLAWCEEAALAAADRIVVVSDVGRRALLASGFADERIVLNPNGVDTSRFMNGGGPELREELGINSNAVVVGFVGSFGPWHGAPALAEAFVRAAAEAPELRLLLVGDGGERDATRSVLEDAGAEQKAIFVGSVASAAVPRYLDACDILVAPHVPLPGGAEFFGSPTKLFEYMASGKSIAASRLAQIGDVLEDEVTALLVTPGDRAELAAAIVRLARDPALRGRLGETARTVATEHHSWRDNAERIAAAYRSLANPRIIDTGRNGT